MTVQFIFMQFSSFSIGVTKYSLKLSLYNKQNIKCQSHKREPSLKQSVSVYNPKL